LRAVKISTAAFAAVVAVVAAGVMTFAADRPPVPKHVAASSAAPVTTTPTPTPTAAPTTPPPASVFDTGMTVPHTDEGDLWLSWSLVDRAGHREAGSANRSSERTNSESSMKAWITTDLVRVAGERGRALRANEKSDIEAALRRSDDQAAERIYRSLGADQVLRDLKSVCGVSVSTSRRGYWAYSQITATDATSILRCVLDRAPTYPDGGRIVTALHGVEPDNAFGIPEALPAGTDVAVKNGWTAHSATGQWNVDCVASWSDYTLAVLTRYPVGRQLDYGAGVCRDVTAALLPRLPGQR
jgi:hypothetical protein